MLEMARSNFNFDVKINSLDKNGIFLIMSLVNLVY